MSGTFTMVEANHERAHLQCHEETLAFDICEAKVDAARVAVGITIADYVLDAGVDAVDKTVGKGFYAGTVPLKGIDVSRILTS